MTEETHSAEEQAPEEEAHEEGKRERYRVAGEKLLSKVKELLQEGNIRRITIKNDEDRTLIEIPLTWASWARRSSPCGLPWGPSRPW